MAEYKEKLVFEGIHHIAMDVENFDKTVNFYTEGLGFKIHASWEKNNVRGAMLDTGDGTYFEIFEKTDNKKSQIPYIHAALRTCDCDLAFRDAVNAGASVKMEPTDITIKSKPPIPARIAFCIGPDGEIIELFQEK